MSSEKAPNTALMTTRPTPTIPPNALVPRSPDCT